MSCTRLSIKNGSWNNVAGTYMPGNIMGPTRLASRGRRRSTVSMGDIVYNDATTVEIQPGVVYVDAYNKVNSFSKALEKLHRC